MNTFFVIAGIVVTVVGLLAIAVLSGVYIAVKFLGATIRFGNIDEDGTEL